MNEEVIKQAVKEALASLQTGSLHDGAVKFWATLGYTSERTIDLGDTTAEGFAAFTAAARLPFRNEPKRSHTDQWAGIYGLFQIQDKDISASGGRGSGDPFSSVDTSESQIKSYLFFALDMKHGVALTRTELSHISREINRPFPMPVLLLVRQNGPDGATLTLVVQNRRQNKTDADRDVLEKVTLIKDIRLGNPHRAHLEILADLHLNRVGKEYRPKNFDDLHEAWSRVLSVSALNERFYKELANWYFWARNRVRFPGTVSDDKEEEKRRSEAVIRLITRLIFVWFLREKGLVPEALFRADDLRDLVVDFTRPDAPTYYRAILQNLFFATLNAENNNTHRPRRFREDPLSEIDDEEPREYDLWEYKKLLRDPQKTVSLWNSVPFLNGGLFECLGEIDGFSEDGDLSAYVPNDLFFGGDRPCVECDLNTLYGTKGKQYSVQGLIHLLNQYKFTIDENTPIEEEIALDPELLGKVFENLLASYNPETETTARKQTGSFYTPRPIVDYMVDEALVAYLATQTDTGTDSLRRLITYNDDTLDYLSAKQINDLVSAIDRIKILDPACGSGAFPMGVLQKLVYLLGKLDKNNARWQETQRARAEAETEVQRKKAIDETEKAFRSGDKNERDKRLGEISDAFEEKKKGIYDAFENNASDYGRKLYLIENGIYGVDIQPIAVQISKLRFFISLVIDQESDPAKENFGIRPLPNLETKFVAANSLILISRPAQLAIRSNEVEDIEAELLKVRKGHFMAWGNETKKQRIAEDKALREKLRIALAEDSYPLADANRIADWNPYNVQTVAKFFDPEWMFGFTDGFDICIGNPPYLFARNSVAKGITAADKKLYYEHYTLAEYQINLYPIFIERGTNLLKSDGVLSFITPNNWLTINTNKNLREYVLRKTDVQIVNFYKRVFESADVDSSIITYRKSGGESNVSLYEYEKSLQFVKKAPTAFFRGQRDQIINIEALKGDGVAALMAKIEDESDRLSDVANVRVGLKAYQTGKGKPAQTEQAKNGRIFHANHQIDATYHQYLDGKDVSRYRLGWSGEYLKYGNHLAEPRRDFNLFSSPRILVRQIPAPMPYCIHACYTDKTLLNDLNSMNVINLTEPPESVLGILNSRLVSFWFVHKFGKMQRGIFPQFKINELEHFPLPKKRKGEAAEIAALVKTILVAKAASPLADTADAEQRIDAIVYGLYDLTPDEIHFVENGDTTDADDVSDEAALPATEEV